MVANKNNLDKIITRSDIDSKEIVSYIEKSLSLLYKTTADYIEKFKQPFIQYNKKYLNSNTEPRATLETILTIDLEFAIGLYTSLKAIAIVEEYKDNREFFIGLYEELNKIELLKKEKIPRSAVELIKHKIIEFGYKYETERRIPSNIVYNLIKNAIGDLSYSNEWNNLDNREKAEKIVEKLIEYIHTTYDKTREKLYQLFS
jgi:hypothetical protein